jgi:hypothetical protein
MIVNDHFKKLLFETQMTSTQIEKLSRKAISRGTVDTFKIDGNPGVKIIYEILKIFPELNIDWLFTGRGKQYFEEKVSLSLSIEEPEGTYETKLRLLTQKNTQLVNENNELKNKLIEIQSFIIKSK